MNNLIAVQFYHDKRKVHYNLGIRFTKRLTNIGRCINMLEETTETK